MKLHFKLLLFFLVLSNLSLGFYIINENAFFDKKNQHSLNQISNLKEQSKAIAKEMAQAIYFAGTAKLSPQVKLVDIDNTSRNLSDILGVKKILFYRFTETNCDACVEAEMIYLKELAKKIGIERIVLLVSYGNLNELKAIRNTYQIQFAIYNTPYSDLLNNGIEKLNVPYAFLADKLNGINMVFIPDKSYPIISDEYHKTVLNILLNK